MEGKKQEQLTCRVLGAFCGFDLLFSFFIKEDWQNLLDVDNIKI